MQKTLLPILVLLTVGCGRSTEAVPPILPGVQTTNGNAKLPSSGKPKATAQVVQTAFASQDEEPKKEADKEPGPVPDKGTKLVNDLLRPANKSLADEPGRKRLSGPAFLERPQIAAEVYKGLPPKVGVKDAGKPVRPRPAAEDIPLSRFYGDPQLPVVVKLEGTALVKWPSPDPNEPVPLPILAQPKLDRAPLTDPTADASTDAALSGVIPLRDNPAPFLRTNLPDPFENRQTIKVRNPLPEDPTPQTR